MDELTPLPDPLAVLELVVLEVGLARKDFVAVWDTAEEAVPLPVQLA